MRFRKLEVRLPDRVYRAVIDGAERYKITASDYAGGGILRLALDDQLINPTDLGSMYSAGAK